MVDSTMEVDMEEGRNSTENVDYPTCVELEFGCV